MEFDVVVANPPFSLRWDPSEETAKDFRFSRYGIAPKSAADFAFLLHGLHYLSENGTMAIILPHGVLFRGGKESVGIIGESGCGKSVTCKEILQLNTASRRQGKIEFNGTDLTTLGEKELNPLVTIGKQILEIVQHHLFNKHEKGSNIIYFNYLPYDNTFSQAIRISHDGYVSGCLDMFYEDYTTRAIGNINEMPIGQVLRQFFCHRPL